MILEGKVTGVLDDERVIKITIEIKKMNKPMSPDATEARDDKHLEEMMNRYNERVLEFTRQKIAIENLGVREATIFFEDIKEMK